MIKLNQIIINSLISIIYIFNVFFFQHHGIDLSGAGELMRQYGIPGKLYPRLSFISALAGPEAVFVITLLSALFPAFKIRKFRPVEAMSYV